MNYVIDFVSHLLCTHPVQGPVTMGGGGGGGGFTEVHWAIIVIGCTVYIPRACI